MFHQLDINNVFFYGDLFNKVYTTIPFNFRVIENNQVYKFKKSL